MVSIFTHRLLLESTPHPFLRFISPTRLASKKNESKRKHGLQMGMFVLLANNLLRETIQIEERGEIAPLFRRGIVSSFSLNCIL